MLGFRVSDPTGLRAWGCWFQWTVGLRVAVRILCHCIGPRDFFETHVDVDAEGLATGAVNNQSAQINIRNKESDQAMLTHALHPDNHSQAEVYSSQCKVDDGAA